MTALSPTRALANIYFEPRTVLAALPQRPMGLVPLALMVLGNVLLWAWYYQVVDIAWLQDRLIDSDAGIADASQRRAAQSVLTRKGLALMSIAGALVVLPGMVALLAAYLSAAGRVLGAARPYRQWFGLASWAMAPMLLLLPVMALQISLSGNGQLLPEALNPLSLNQLVFGFERGQPWTALLSSINVTTAWNVALLALGLRIWTQRPVATCVAAAVAPFAIVYLAWAARVILGAGA